MAKLTALGHVGLAYETTFGTAVAPVVFIPYSSVKPEDDVKKTTDDNRRAVLSQDFAVYNGSQQSKFDFDTYAYTDILGYLLKGILGQDTVTGSSAPYSHKFQVVNAMGPSMTLTHFDGNDTRQYAGSILSEVAVKFDSTDNPLSVAPKFEGKLGVVTSAVTPTMPTTSPFMGWQLVPTINNVANLNVVGGEFTIKREAKLLFTANNTKDPTKYSSARIAIDGKLTFDIEDATEYTWYTAGNQIPISLDFKIDNGHELTVEFGLVDITKATKDESQEFVRVDIEFKALYNTNDAGNTTITLKNSVATY